MKLGELMEKYKDSPDRDRLIAKAMGWKEIVEMLAAEWKSDTEGEMTSLSADLDPLEDGEASEALVGEEDFAESDAIEDDPLRHPLVAELLERSASLMKLAEGGHDYDLEEMVSGFMIVGPKVAGALGRVMSGWDEELNGLAVAKLKRAMGELSPRPQCR